MPDLEPVVPNVFAAAVHWLDGTLLGTIATTVAVMAVASLGILVMSGRIEMRNAIRVIMGCFILFGASSISAGIIQALDGQSGVPVQISASPPLPAYSETVPIKVVPAQPYDPYAGAALPTR